MSKPITIEGWADKSLQDDKLLVDGAEDLYDEESDIIPATASYRAVRVRITVEEIVP